MGALPLCLASLLGSAWLDLILEGLARLECGDAGCRDLYFCTRLGVTSRTRLAVARLERPKSSDLDFALAYDAGHDDVEGFVDNLGSGCLRLAGIASDSFDKLSLVNRDLPSWSLMLR